MPDDAEKDREIETRVTYGTAAHDAPVAREDLERALRHLNLSDLEQRDLVLRLAAHVVALTEELAPDARARVQAATEPTYERIRAADARATPSVWLSSALEDKYEIDTSGSSPPCDELLHLCNARCCSFDFPLSTQDLDEGVIRWDYGRPYLIRQRASDGFCVHHDPASKQCAVHAQRPGPCRHYDCRKDARVWVDYAARIPAPMGSLGDGKATLEPFDLVERVKLRTASEAIETNAVSRTYPDDAPTSGPAVEPRKPRPSR